MGPVWLAMRRLQQTVGSLVEEGDPEYTASKLWQLACHVMPNAEALEKLQDWNRIVIDGMEQAFLRSENDLLGDVVPREFFNPPIEIRTNDTELLINQFLKTLSPSSNPFLNTPERMLEEGFVGIPYTFDLSRDREARGIARE